MKFILAKNKTSMSGFTLVELLVGLVLTLFISAIAITYMISTSQSFKAQTNDALSQENASLLLVGDAKQSIYRWRGGEARSDQDEDGDIGGVNWYARSYPRHLFA